MKELVDEIVIIEIEVIDEILVVDVVVGMLLNDDGVIIEIEVIDEVHGIIIKNENDDVRMLVIDEIDEQMLIELGLNDEMYIDECIDYIYELIIFIIIVYMHIDETPDADDVHVELVDEQF